jgi:hypothetical protein
MKNKIIIYFCLIAFLGISKILCAQEIAKYEQLYQKISAETLNPYFEALRNGDILTIKKYLSAETYTRYRDLLENNKDYPQFLQNYYQDVEFQVEKIERIGNDISVSIVIKFPDHGSLNSKIFLRENMDDANFDIIGGRWKIVTQINE